LVAAAVTGHLWITRQRVAGQYLYRKVYTAATIVLACLAASAVLHESHRLVGPLPAGLRFATIVVIALAVYTVVNRLLISFAMLFAGAPISARAILGTWDDNALEIATLCLAFFAALAVVYQAWLLPLILPPIVLLERGALVKELEQTASTDTKTLLLTALAWQQTSERALRQAVRDKAEVAVILIDLDHFKKLNDTWGHLVGDTALRKVSEQLRRELRKTDVVGRFGGEEFVILLPDLSLEAALVVAERIRARIRAIALADIGVTTQLATSERPLSASLGVAHSPPSGIELADLLIAADAALYDAKRSGRDRVALARGLGGGEGVAAEA
jgi:diguanylate cyclase (GGDEF)-like protein